MKALLAGCAIASGLLLAQAQTTPPAGGPTRTAPTYTELKTALGLTDAQVTQLTGIQTAKRTASQTIMQQIATLQQTLQTQLKATPPNAQQIGQTMIQIQTLQGQITGQNATYNTQALAVLSADQKTKLATLQNALTLQPAISQALSLDLLAHPQGQTAGPGFGPRGGPGFGPAMFGPRPGRFGGPPPVDQGVSQ